MAFLISDDDAENVVSSGTRIDGQPFVLGDEWVLQTPIGFVPSAPPPDPFLLPDLYDYYPVIVKAQDTELVDRPGVPIYQWDTTLSWDTTPFTWDAIILPEPILRTTTRVFQLELERSAREIRDLIYLWNLERTSKDKLPYIAQLLGTPLPSAGERAQRAFLQNLIQTYKNKGTLLSFQTLFLSLGFQPLITERYQRKSDASFVTGPQTKVVSSNRVLREPKQAVTVSPTYTIQMLETPIVRGSLQVEIFADSAFTPTVVNDNGDGGWQDLSLGVPIPGTIDYVTGQATFTLPAPPTNIGGEMRVNYRYLTDRFPDPHNRRWTDRFRSSYVRAQLFPKDPSVILTLRLVERLKLYLLLLKPAHVLIEALEVVFPLEDDVQDTLEDQGPIIPPHSYLFHEHVFGSLYLGYGWAYPQGVASGYDDNGSINIININQKDRQQGEIISVGNSDDLADLPYVYPFKLDGKAYRPNPGDNYEFFGINPLNTSPRTTQFGTLPPTTTAFAISPGAFPAGLGGPGTIVAFTSGINEGEARSIVSVDTSPGVYYDIVVAPALPFPPDIGDALTLLDPNALALDGLVDRPQDPLELHKIPVVPGPTIIVPLGAY